MRRLFFVVLATLLFLGCVDIDVKTAIHPDGGGKQIWKFTTTALLANRVRDQIERNPFFARNKAKFTDEFKEGDYILQADVEFNKVTDLQDNFRNISFERTGIFQTTYTYTETWKQSFDQGGLIPQQAAGLVPVTLKLSVDLPGKIVDSNAQTVDGSIAQWNLHLTDLVQSKTFRAVSRRLNFLVLVPALVLVVAILIGAVFLLLSILNKPRPVVVSAAPAGTRDRGTWCKDSG